MSIVLMDQMVKVTHFRVSEGDTCYLSDHQGFKGDVLWIHMSSEIPWHLPKNWTAP